jgi:peptidoglycan hydrolase-like protein with peptidoglycan-binding domain
MTYALVWMKPVLESAGLKVAEVDGWQNRGRAEFGQSLGVMCHHTAGPKSGNMPTLRTLVEGRDDLPGPLSQLGLGRDGTYYLVAAGLCNHAGVGAWRGITTGNSNFIGIEAENTGSVDDNPWPDVQMDAYRRGAAALLGHMGRNADFCVGHREFALPPGRKTDPDFDMDAFRQGVASILAGTAPPPVLIPKFEPAVAPAQQPGRPTLRRGASGDLVRQIQVAVGINLPTGEFDAVTEAAVRAFQSNKALVPDGIVGPQTWEKIGIR